VLNLQPKNLTVNQMASTGETFHKILDETKSSGDQAGVPKGSPENPNLEQMIIQTFNDQQQ